MPIRLFIFDLDGTLIDTLTDITNSLNYAFNKLGLEKQLAEKQVKGLVGEGIGKLIEKAVEETKAGGQKGEKKLVEDLKEQFLSHYRKHLLDNTDAYPGVPETLRSLAGFKKAIITNKKTNLTKKILEGLDIARYFDLVVGPETAADRKPSPEPVFYVLRKLKMEPEEAVVIGDSRFDVETGRRARVKCVVAVTYGYGNEKGPAKEADYAIGSIDELVSTLYKNEPMLERRTEHRD